MCCVDLSGPDEATPRPGKHVQKDPCHYFLALTVRPDKTASDFSEAATQTVNELDLPVENAPLTDQVDRSSADIPDRSLIYAALLGAKSEATMAI